MIIRNSLGVFLFIFWLILGMSTPASAKERVLGSFIAKGKVFFLEDGKMVFQGDAKGTVTHKDGKGKLDTARLYCSITMYVDKKNNKEEGNGFCSITAVKGDKIYANFKCAGPLKKCKGKFNHLGGSGAYKGISGETDFRWKAHIVRPAQTVESADFVEQEIFGYFVLPDLTYTLGAN